MRSGSCRASGRCWPRLSSPRLATSAASPARVAVLLGGPDAAAPRVRCQGSARARDEAGLADPALGGDRGGPVAARRCPLPPGQGRRHRPPRQGSEKHRQGRHRPRAAVRRFLCHARRPRPSRSKTRPARSRPIPSPAASRGTCEGMNAASGLPGPGRPWGATT